MMRSTRATRLVGLALFFALSSSCGGLVRYGVTKTPTADCIIRFNGEFCDEEERLPPPTSETWAAETVDDKTILYIGEETWIADGTEGERRVVKLERSGRELCTTTSTRTLVFEIIETDEGTAALVGTFEDKVRVDGPTVCGETPFGTRRAFALSGTVGGVL
jgi:hypothetical protein